MTYSPFLEPFLIAATLTSGMMAGLFFIFSVSVMRTLRTRKAAIGIEVMQSINQTIVNPLFVALYLLSPVLCAVLVFLSYSKAEILVNQLCLIGGLIYLIGSFGLTQFLHIPMNNKLDKVTPNSDEGKAYWKAYMDRWIPWNHVRGLASFVAALLFAFALGSL